MQPAIEIMAMQIWIGGRQGDADAGLEFLGCALATLRKACGGSVSNVALRHGERRWQQRYLAELMQQPIGAAVQEQAELVGFPASRHEVRSDLVIELVLLDHVFHPTAGRQ